MFCHLYDVGPNYLVMELVEGEPLRGPLPLGEAIPVLRQLIDGIEAAHEKGITHRDLKPANILITPDGVVKILDFGLAKLNDPNASNGPNDPNGPNASQSPTMTSPAMLTGAGMVLGTAAYMAPEQARGKVADHRADVWAFGVVVYELLTGRPAFRSETVVIAKAEHSNRRERPVAAIKPVSRSDIPASTTSLPGPPRGTSPFAPSHLALSHLVPLWWQSAFTSPYSCRALLLLGTMVGSAGLPR